MNQRAGLTTTPAPGDGAGLRLEINQQEIVGGWATGNGVIAWPESGKINRMHGDSRGQVKGVFGDCQFTCFPDCQLALSPDPAMNHFFDGAAPCSNSQCREAVATPSKTLAKPRVTGIGIDWFLAVPQELLGYRYVRLVGRGGHHAVRQTGYCINTDMGFHAEKPLVAFSSLLH